MAIIGIIMGLIGAAAGIVAGMVGGLIGIVAGLLGACLGLLPVLIPIALIAVGVVWLANSSNSSNGATEGPSRRDAVSPNSRSPR